ncbi:MAG: BolA family protein [Candidatus Caenarcaniphilales bacterium]|nr:BolA family protein [Candidatus Caenarcaniphilales bacterium]
MSKTETLQATIESILKEKINAAEVKIIDDGHKHLGHQPGDPAYFTIEVISSSFEGKSLIQQHKMVYESLKEQLKEQIHALSIKTKLPNT